MKIKNILKSSRPREKLIKNGVKSLSDEELLAIILRCGNKDLSAIDMSYDLINRFNGLHNLVDLTYNELAEVKGIKEAKAAIILACFELSKRAFSIKPSNVVYDNPRALFELISPLVITEKTECLYAIYLDSKCHLIEYEFITRGSFNCVVIPNQEIYKKAIRLSSGLVCIVHNHPSGDVTPSKNDIISTKNLKEALDILGIMLIDSLIIGKDNYYSFHESDNF